MSLPPWPILWLLGALLPQVAWSATCDPATLEQLAYQGRLDEGERRCVEGALRGDDPQARASASLVLIVHAWLDRDFERYEQLMRRHLTELHTTDAEVAFLYATHLYRQLGRADDEVLRWAKVAMEGRSRWLQDRANYDGMVKSLYDLLVQASMERAIAAKEAAADDPSRADHAERCAREARYWLVMAAPCLHEGDCGPYYEVEVDGWAPCDDLVALESAAALGRLTDEHATCLRSRYRKPGVPKSRILALLMAWADAADDPERWTRLRAWHWKLEGETFEIAWREAQWMAAHGEPAAAVEAATVAVLQLETLGRRAAGIGAEVHRLRVDQAEALLRQVRSPGAAAGGPTIAEAEAEAARARLGLEQWCTEVGCP